MAENKNRNTNNPTDIDKVTEKAPYQDMTLGNQIYGGGGSKKFKTGEWRTQTPVMNWEKIFVITTYLVLTLLKKYSRTIKN